MRGKQAIDFRRFLEDKERIIERDIRRREADWSYINSLPIRIREAVILFIEMGDLRLAQHIARMELEDFLDILRKARIPPFITTIYE
ncbi:MAG: hypothetical protein QXY40_01835 [Candidatus Methanomethylicia archaeon]